MSRLYARAGWRALLRHPAQLALALAGIALGVAVVTGVGIANDSARRAFDLSAQLVTGRATHQLVGTGGTLRDSAYAELRRAGVHRAAPLVEAPVRFDALPGHSLTLLGVDPLSATPLRDALGPGAPRVDIARLVTVPRTVALPEPLAQRLGAGLGTRLRLSAGGRPHDVEVVGLLKVDEARKEVAARFVYADIATAQELLGLEGRIHRVDLELAPGQVATVRALAQPDAYLVDADSQGTALTEMTQAFRINLQALSLLALVVGAFLVYATLSFLALRRRPAAGTARALGLRRRSLLTAMLGEALALGVVGTAFGLLLGHVLGSGLTGLVLRTITDLYYQGAVAAAPGTGPYLRGAVMGLAATVTAGLAPALAYARTAPRRLHSRADLEAGLRARRPRALAFAALATGAAIVLLVDQRLGLWGAFAGLFCVVAAAASLTPAISTLLLRALQAPAGWVAGLPGRLAAGGAAAALSRTGVAVTALSVAVATVVGIGVMIESFRGSVTDWLDDTLQSDFYLRVAPGAVPDGLLDEALLARLRAMPGVTGLSLARWQRIATGGEPLQLRALAPGPEGWGLTLVAGDSRQAWHKLEAGAGILVSEPLARRLQLSAGGLLALPTASGTHEFPILGVFRDYSSDRGAVLMHLSAWRQHWRDASLTGVGVYLEPGEDAEAARSAIEALVSETQGLQFGASAEIRAASLQIFERSFQVTESLRWLAGLVAFLGVLSALLALEIERQREVAVLRTLGFTPAMVRRLLVTQAGLLGLVAGLVALPLGVLLAGLLVQVINLRAFGWSMGFDVPVDILAQGLGLAISAALLAGLLPAWRLARAPLAPALREE